MALTMGLSSFTRPRRRRLRDIEPYKVDLVDRAANKRKFLVFKEDTMPDPILGPALIDDGDGLHTPDEGTDLERAAAALETMTVQLGELVSELKKDDDAPVAPVPEVKPEEPTEVEVATAAFREISERAAKMYSDGPPDMTKVTAEANELINMLKSVVERPTAKAEEPVVVDPPAVIDPPIVEPPPVSQIAPGPAFRVLAETALDLSNNVPAEMQSEFAAKARELADRFAAVAEALQIAKSDKAPEGIDEEASQEAIGKILHDIAMRLGIVAKVAGETPSDKVSDVIAGEFRKAWDMATSLGLALPQQIEKAASKFSSTLGQIAGRAMRLASSARQAGFSEPKAMKELKQLSALINGLIAKYPGVKKAEDLELPDLGMVLNAEHMLNDFEDALRKHSLIAPEPVAPVIETPVAPVIETPVVAIAPEVTPEPVIPDPNALLAKMEAMQKQIATLQSFVAKARGEVPPPASAGEELALTTNDDPMLFPHNYNSSEYREALGRRS